MRLSTRFLLILALPSFTAASGCNFLPSLFCKEVKVNQNQVAELREPAKVKVWVHEKDGTLRRAYVRAHPGWLIGPPAPESEASSTPATSPAEIGAADGR
jgi:hypothetical protein